LVEKRVTDVEARQSFRSFDRAPSDGEVESGVGGAFWVSSL
jgi:hypothetical protein